LVTVEHIRLHVIEDAGDLISLIGMLDPIVTTTRSQDGDDKAHALRLLRRLLSRYLVLVVCRLHELPHNNGRTGRTASIDALLDIAGAQLPGFNCTDILKARRKEIISELEFDGVRFLDLRSFRTAEIAHSLHRNSMDGDSTLTYSAIVSFARKTYELILEIEQNMVIAGLPSFTDTPYLAEAWQRRGTSFWYDALAR